MAIICWTSSNVYPRWIYLEKHLRKISVTGGYFGSGTIFVITYHSLKVQSGCVLCQVLSYLLSPYTLSFFSK